MHQYKFLLWDIDGTVLDFKAAESVAIKALFSKYNFGECTDEMVSCYSSINDKYWKALERNEITKSEILIARFVEFFELVGVDSSLAVSFNDDYQVALGDTIVFRDDSYTLLQSLKNKYTLIAVTNGTKIAQDKKLSVSGLDRIFDYIFISEEVGIEKPNKGFFDKVIASANIEDTSKALIIGDSLTSDIRGGNNAGIDTCWYNPNHLKNDKGVEITYEIDDLRAINEILDIKRSHSQKCCE